MEAVPGVVWNRDVAKSSRRLRSPRCSFVQLYFHLILHRGPPHAVAPCERKTTQPWPMHSASRYVGHKAVSRRRHPATRRGLRIRMSPVVPTGASATKRGEREAAKTSTYGQTLPLDSTPVGSKASADRPMSPVLCDLGSCVQGQAGRRTTLLAPFVGHVRAFRPLLLQGRLSRVLRFGGRRCRLHGA